MNATLCTANPQARRRRGHRAQAKRVSSDSRDRDELEQNPVRARSSGCVCRGAAAGNCEHLEKAENGPVLVHVAVCPCVLLLEAVSMNRTRCGVAAPARLDPCGLSAPCASGVGTHEHSAGEAG